NGSIMTSSNGSEWTTRNSGVTYNLVLVKFVNGRFFALPPIPDRLAYVRNTALVSDDGVNWTNLTQVTDFTDITFNGSFYCGAAPRGVGQTLPSTWGDFYV